MLKLLIEHFNSCFINWEESSTPKYICYNMYVGFPGGSVGKESVCSAGDAGSIPGLERSPGEGHGNLLPYSQSQTQLKRLKTHAHNPCASLN